MSNAVLSPPERERERERESIKMLKLEYENINDLKQRYQFESLCSPTHPVPPSLAYISHALSLPPPPSLLPLLIHMDPSTFICHTQTHLSSDSTGRPGQPRMFLAVI